MSSTVCDSSAVDAYLQELSNREVERTRRLQIENYRREIPFQVLKFIAIGIAIAIVLLALSKMINSANNSHNITEILGGYGEQILTPSNNYSNTEKAPYKEDTIIDVDAILDNAKMPEAPKITDKNVVRNYVIFDEVEFDGKAIREVITGRNYPDVDSDVDHSWCYITNNTSSSGSLRLSLITIKDGIRTNHELNQTEADKFGASLEEIIRARKECTI